MLTAQAKGLATTAATITTTITSTISQPVQHVGVEAQLVSGWLHVFIGRTQ